MAEVIKMPKMSDTMEEGVIASWRVKVGDKVKSGDILAEVETDKATMELESFEDGVILHLGVKVKEAIKVNGVIAVIGKEGENIDELLKTISSPAAGQKAAIPQQEAASIPADSTENIKASIITMPKMSDTMTQGVIANWLKKVGDTVKPGEIIAEVETDKATMELEAFEGGKLLYIGVEAGSSVAIDGVIAVIGEEGADYQKLLEARKGAVKSAMLTPVNSKAPAATPAPSQVVVPSVVNGSPASNGERIKASPLAKKLAKDLGYDISQIKGSGDFGRIVKRDVESYTPQKAAATEAKSKSDVVVLPKIVGEESYSDVTLSQMRKTIARRLSESKFTAPHFYLTMEINMDRAVEARASMNEISPVKISFNDMVIKAVAAALRMNPKVNVSWRGETLRMNNHIHIGVAVAVEEGLLVPVIRFADNKSLSHIASEVKTLAEKASKKQLQPADWEGNTFTISNLGMFGIEEFTAIINPPDACILAIGGIKQTPVVKDGQIVPGNVMKVTLSCDHRAVDGAVGAAFLKTLKGLLEDPVRLLI